MSFGWTADAAMRRRREGAVSDVLDDGLSEISAATRWGVQVDDVRQWVADARANERAES